MRARVPIPTLARMGLNIVLDTLLGLVPFAGDLLDGTWDARHGALRTLPRYEGSLVLLVAEP